MADPDLAPFAPPHRRAGAARFDTLGPPALFVVAAVSQYVGAAVAVLLFAAVPAAGVAWLRVAVAALVLLAWRRPWRAGWQGLRGPSAARVPWVLVVAFGTALAGMNLAFYLAIAHLPLGTAVAIEFLGPIVVAAAGSRTRRDVGAFCLAVGGVALLAEVSITPGAGPEAVRGVAYALAAAGLWAAYILLGSRVATTGRGVDRLAVAMAAGALAIAPFTVGAAAPAFADARLLLLCLGVALASSVVPYVLDQVVLARVGPARFALLLALLPATAALVGALVLGQVPAGAEALGIGLVVAAVAVRSPR